MSEEKKLKDEELESVTGGLYRRLPKSDVAKIDMIEDPTDTMVAVETTDEGNGVCGLDGVIFPFD